MQDYYKYVPKVKATKTPTSKSLKMPEAPKPVLTENQELLQNLTTQSTNLTKRIEAVGAESIVDNRSFIEKMFNLPDEQGVLMDIIEVLERPMRGLQAGLLGAQEGTGFGQGVLRGLTGQERFTGVEFADRMGWLDKEELGGFGEFVANVGIDILMDPFTWFAPTKMLKWAFGAGSKATTSFLGETMETLVRHFDEIGLDFYKASADDIAKVADDLGIELFKVSDEAFTEAGINISKSNNKIYFKGEAAKGAGGAKEYSVPHLLADYIDAAKGEGFDDIRFLIEKAENNITDVRMLREVTLANGEKVGVMIDKLEVKDFFEGAAGITISLDIVDNKIIPKKFFKGGKKATKFGAMPEDFQEIFVEAINKLKIMSDDTGKTITELVQDAINIAGDQDELFKELVGKGTSDPDFLKFFGEGLRTAKDKVSLQKFQKLLPKQVRDLFKQLPSSARKTITESFEKYGKGLIGQDELIKTIDDLAGGLIKFDDIQQGLFENYVRLGKKAKGTTSVPLNQSTLMQKLGLSNTKYGDDFSEILKHYFLTNADEYIAFTTKVDGVDTLQMLKKSQVFDFVDTTGRIQYAGSSTSKAAAFASGQAKARQLRLVPSMTLKEDAVLDSTQVIEDFLSKFYVQGTEEVAPGFVIQMLGKLSSEGMPAIVRKPAEIIDGVIKRIGFMFNGLKDLSNKFVGDIRRIAGRTGVRLQRQSNQLAALTARMSVDNPKAQSLARQLIEAGATIVRNDQGEVVEVVAKNFTPRIADMFDNIKVHSTAGNTTIMNTWGKTGNELELLAKNLEKSLNDAYFKLTGTSDAVLVRLKDGALGVDLMNIDPKALNKVDFQSLLGDEMFTAGGRYNLTDEMKDFFIKHEQDISDFKTLEFDILDTLKKEAGYDNFNEALKYAPEYVRHTLSGEGKAWLAKQKPAARSKYVQEGIDMLMNRTYMGTIDDINKGMRAFYGVNVDLFDTGIQASFEDLIRVSATKGEQAQIFQAILKGADETGNNLFQVIPNKSSALDELGYGFVSIRSFQEEYGDIYRNLSPEVRKVLDDQLAKLGYDVNTSALAIHRSAKNLLDGINRSYKELPDYIRGYDKFMNMWKSVTLVTPGFHMRNLFGNITNSYLAGMNTFQQGRYAAKAMGDFSVYSRLNKGLMEFSGTYDEFLETLGKTDREAFERVLDFFESGVSQSYTGVRDLASVKKTLEEGGKRLSKQLVGANFDIAQHMDDFQRYMLYQWSLDGATKTFGKDASLMSWQIQAKARQEAQRKVAESLFDYKHFTSFEQDFMKRVFPFYTFFKNNLVFQMKTLFNNPGAVGRIGRAYKYYTEDIGGVDLEQMPDYMLNNMWLPIPAEITKDDTEAIAFLKANLPLSDFTEIIENPLKRGVTSVSAPIKLLFELGAGVDFFTGSPIERFPGERDRMDPGSGVMSQLRNEDGDLALSASPVMQKIANDLGLRVPREYLSVLFDVADAVSGTQPSAEVLGDILGRFGLTATTSVEQMNLTQMYQDLERLKYIQDRYEQQVGDLPTKAELGID